MSKYLAGGEEWCPLNSRYLESCISLDAREISVPRGVLNALIEIATKNTDWTERELEPHHAKIVGYVAERCGGTADNLQYLARYLKYDGVLYGALNDDVRAEAFELCDGYGNLTLEELRERELLGDWSHVRDSTPEALYAARTYIEAALGFKG